MPQFERLKIWFYFPLKIKIIYSDHLEAVNYILLQLRLFNYMLQNIIIDLAGKS